MGQEIMQTSYSTPPAHPKWPEREVLAHLVVGIDQ